MFEWMNAQDDWKTDSVDCVVARENFHRGMYTLADGM
jgi:hypothetical protein